MIVPVPDTIEPAAKLRRVHFVGVGGAALSGLARLMSQLGVGVSGSDAVDSAMLETLREIGVRVFVGHRAEIHLSFLKPIGEIAIRKRMREKITA